MDWSAAEEGAEALVAGDTWQRAFHSLVREVVIVFLLFTLLLAAAHGVVRYYIRREPSGDSPTTAAPLADEDEAAVRRCALLVCTFSLALAAGAALLLPASIAANEILLHYPDSYYIQWLNDSLIECLWRYVFLLSNLSLFVLLPFAYLLTESEGFAGHGKGVLSRIYETFTVLVLIAVLAVGASYVVAALLDVGESGRRSLRALWTTYLPLLYAGCSAVGVLALLLCTPLGVGRLFDLVGRLLVRPHLLDGVEERYQAARLEEAALLRRLAQPAGADADAECRQLRLSPESAASLTQRLEETRRSRASLERRRRASPLERNLGYPLVMLTLLALTAAAELLVLRNAVELLVGIKALPLSTRQAAVLGLSSLSALGPVGAALQITLICYLLVTSVVGLYSAPGARRLRPRPGDTPLPALLANSAAMLLLSSALPLLIRTLGITSFDLLGAYGRVRWLGHFNIVLFYNVVFAVASALCLVTKFTSTVRQALVSRLVALRRSASDTAKLRRLLRLRQRSANGGLSGGSSGSLPGSPYKED